MIRSLLSAAALLASTTVAPAAAAPASEGARIENVAGARWTDDASGEAATTASNTVSTTVAPLPAATLTDDRSATTAPGGSETFAYAYANTGNVALTVAFDLSAFAGALTTEAVFGLDANGDGVLAPDERGRTASLLPGETASLLVLVTADDGASDGQAASATLTATAPGVPALTAGATIRVAKGALTLAKSVSHAEALVGQRLSYAIEVRNDAASPVLPRGTYDGQPLTIDGQPRTVVLVRDDLPAGLTLSGVTEAGGFTPVYRATGDAPYAFTSAPRAGERTETLGFVADEAVRAGGAARFAFGAVVGTGGGRAIRNTATAPGAAPADDVTSDEVVTLIEEPILIDQPGITLGTTPGQPASLGVFGEDLFVEVTSGACNATAGVDVIAVTLRSAGTGDTETVTATETGPNTGVFRTDAVPVTDRPSAPEDGLLSATEDDTVTATPACDPGLVAEIAVETVAFVFDAATDEGIEGATVTLTDEAGAVVATVTTDAEGRFVLPVGLAGTYTATVTPPAGYVAPSAAASFADGRQVDDRGSFGFPVTIGAGRFDFDVPVDRLVEGLLTTAKTVSDRTGRIGGLVFYTVEARNGLSVPLTGASVVDTLPAGLSYVDGSAARDDASLDDPEVQGQTLTFPLGTLGAGEATSLRYGVRIGANAPDGRATNRAFTAGSAAGEAITSATAIASLRVERERGVLSRDGVIVGRVFLDCDADGVQSTYDEADDDWSEHARDPGIADALLVTEGGLLVRTDEFGRYSLPNQRAGTHVIGVVASSLPTGTSVYQTRVLDAGKPGTRMVTLNAGEVRVEDFALRGCSASALNDAEVRAAAARSHTVREAVRDLSFERRQANLLQAEASQAPDALSVAEGAASVAAAPAPQLAAPLEAPLATVPAAPALASSPVAAPKAAPSPASGAGRHVLYALAIDALAPNALRGERADIEERRAERRTLEQQSEGIAAVAAILNVADGHVFGRRQATIRVAGPAAGRTELRVNDVVVEAGRIGKTIRNTGAAGDVTATEYVAVPLPSGEVTLSAVVTDPFGNERDRRDLTVLVPGAPARVVIEAPRTAPADPTRPVVVTVRVVDADGLAVQAPTDATLSATGGVFDVKDLREGTPGLQAFVPNGRARFDLTPPETVGTQTIEVVTALGTVRRDVRFTADTQVAPIVVGYAEAALREGPIGADLPNPEDSGDLITPFEETQSGFEGALYAKGKIGDDTLLTLRYDSEQDNDDLLFRDEDPDEGYPTFGDRSRLGFDAQSRSGLYAKVERDADYAVFGDLRTQADPAVRLGTYARALTGAQAHAERGRLSADLFVAGSEGRQRVVEFQGRGVSGPYAIDADRLVENSELVELVTRDRDQPSVVLSERTLARYADYSFDYFTGALLFASPVPGLDAELNPVSVRVTFETTDGEDGVVFGGQAAFALTDAITVGIRAVQAEGGDDDTNGVRAAWTRAQLAANTVLEVEVAQSDDAARGTGEAARASLLRATDDSRASVTAAITSEDFAAPGAAVQAGRIEVRADLRQAITDDTRIEAEALHTESRGETEDRITGIRAVVEHDVTDRVTARAGGRAVDADRAAVDGTVVTGILGGGYRTKDGKTRFEVEAEQAFGADRFALRSEASRQLHERLRAYAQGEWTTSDAGGFAVGGREGENVILRGGLDVQIADGVKGYSEYRTDRELFDAGIASGLQAAWDVSDSVALRARGEHVEPVSGTYRGHSSLALGATFQPEDGRSILIGDVEGSTSDDGRETFYVSNTVGHRTDDLTVTLRNRYAWTGNDRGSRSRDRLRAGFAYRPGQGSGHAVLGWYEYETDDDETGAFARRSEGHQASLGAEQPLGDEWRVRGRLAGVQWEEEAQGVNVETSLGIVQAGAERDLGQRFQVAGHVAGLRDFETGDWHAAAGAEVSAVLMDNVVLGVGYAATELETDGVNPLYNDGAYVRLRVKLDSDVWNKVGALFDDE